MIVNSSICQEKAKVEPVILYITNESGRTCNNPSIKYRYDVFVFQATIPNAHNAIALFIPTELHTSFFFPLVISNAYK